MANLSNINNKFLVTTGGNVLIGQTGTIGSSIFQVTGNATFAGNVDINGGLVTLGVADTSSGHINAYENMTFNIDIDNDDTTRYFGFYKNGSDGSGTELLRIEESGNVGIGTSDIDFELQVGGTDLSVTANFDAQFAVLSEATTGYPSGFIFKAPRVATSSNRVLLNEDFGTYFSSQVYATSTGGAQSDIPIVFAPLGGKVGIGDANPSFILDTNITNSRARFKANTGDANIELSSIAGRDWLISSLTDGSLRFYDEDAASERMRINSSGNVTVQESILFANGAPFAGAASIRQQSDSLIFSGGGNGYFFNNDDNTSTNVKIDSGGNVGIGTTSPSQKLEVAGNIRIDSRSKAGSGEVDNITFTKNRPDAATGTYEMGAIRSFTTNGYSGGMTFYSGRHTGGGSYALIAALTIGDPANIGPAVVIKNGDSTSARIYPETDNAGYLGESSHRWQAVYAVNGSIQTSDRNQKTSITKSDLGLDFILKLEPVSYKWKVGGWDIKENGEDKEPTKTPIEGKRNHYGLIAQQVKEVIGDKDFGGWVKEDLEDEASIESLRYAEFISPMIKAIQELKADNDSLKARIETLENN
jgi:hypothetical protein